MQLTPDLIAGFSESILNARYDNPQSTPEFHYELWEYCCSNRDRVAIAAPRGHAKSTAVTLAYPLAALLFGVKKFILILSDTERQAISFLQNIANELETNENLIATFGKAKFIKDSATDIRIRMPDGREFCVMAKGSGQSLRGVRWLNKRPDLVIGDDLENDDIVITPESREKFRQWWLSVVEPMLSDAGEIRIVGTILHLDSFLERLMPEGQLPSELKQEDYILKTRLTTRSTFDMAVWSSIRYKAHDDDFTNILWPSKFSRERLLAIRKGYYQQGFPEGYSREYLNHPIDESTAYFRRGDFLEYKHYTKEHLNFYIGTDFAVTLKNKSDYTVFVVVGQNSEGFICVVDVIRARMDALEIEDTFHVLQKRYNPEFFAVEKGTIWNAISPAIFKGMFKSGNFFQIKEIPSTADKRARAKSIQNRMRAGGVKFLKEADWYPTFEDELIRFDKDIHDDQVDAFSIIGLAIQDIMDAPTLEEFDQDEWEEEMEEAGLLDQGFCTTTGY